VEILAQGAKPVLEKFAAWVKEDAPGQISKVDTKWRESSSIFRDFEITD